MTLVHDQPLWLPLVKIITLVHDQPLWLPLVKKNNLVHDQPLRLTIVKSLVGPDKKYYLPRHNLKFLPAETLQLHQS